jgi:hypothetical protein
VIPNEPIQYYESLVGRQRRRPSESNPHLREYIAEIRDVWEARVILRDLRNRAGIATCSGEVDCLENPISRCMGGKHPTVARPVAISACRDRRKCCQTEWRHSEIVYVAKHVNPFRGY